MSDMNRVAALQVRHPVAFVVDVKADDPSRRAARRLHERDVAYTLGV